MFLYLKSGILATKQILEYHFLVSFACRENVFKRENRTETLYTRTHIWRSDGAGFKRIFGRYECRLKQKYTSVVDRLWVVQTKLCLYIAVWNSSRRKDGILCEGNAV